MTDVSLSRPSFGYGPDCEALGIIRYKLGGGQIRVWTVGASAVYDNEATLRDHLERWMANAVFVSAEVIAIRRT